MPHVDFIRSCGVVVFCYILLPLGFVFLVSVMLVVCNLFECFSNLCVCFVLCFTVLVNCLLNAFCCLCGVW